VPRSRLLRGCGTADFKADSETTERGVHQSLDLQFRDIQGPTLPDWAIKALERKLRRLGKKRSAQK
jgi:hypothetical protein